MEIEPFDDTDSFGVAMLMVCVVIIAGMAVIFAQTGWINQEEADIGDGMYACSSCNWTGHVGLMIHVVKDGLLTSHVDYYCPVCGAEIDVRDE